MVWCAALLEAIEGCDADNLEAGAHDGGGGFAEEQTRGLLVAAEDGARGVKLVVCRRQTVEVLADAVWREVGEEVFDRLRKAHELARERNLRRVLERNPLRRRQRAHVLARLAEDGGDACVGVEEVDGGVAFEVEHAVEAEGVVGGAVVAEVGVLDRAVPHSLRRRLRLRLAELLHLAALAEGVKGTRLGLVEEVDEPHNLARARAEALPVLAEDDSEPHVGEPPIPCALALALEPTRAPGAVEHRLEVRPLSHVRHVNHPVSLLLKDALPHCGKIGAPVVEAAVALAHDKRCLSALAKDAKRSVVLASDALLLELGENLRDVRVVEALAALLERDPESAVDCIELLATDVADAPPAGTLVAVAALEVHHRRLRALLELRILIEAHLGLLVKGLQVPDPALRSRRLSIPTLLFAILEVFDEHSELRSPVADVIEAQHLDACELEGAAQRIADDGAAQVSDVHLFGDVWRAEVDHRLAHALWCRWPPPARSPHPPLLRQQCAQPLREPIP
mmetsp:Transcript_790/g.2883  ORF Transcript_790/g.2883 Transcript_790/m.2883 type:complete len:509 (-) Transcript_790:586-2112(-)